MKKLTLCLTLAAFALIPALQAGENKECAKNAAACSEKAKGAACSEAKSACASACSKSAALKNSVKAGSKGATLLMAKR